MLLVLRLRNSALSKWWIVQARRAKRKGRGNTQQWAFQSQPRSPLRSQLGEEHPLSQPSSTCHPPCLFPNEITTDERLYLYHPLGISPTTWIEFSSSFPFSILLPTTARWAIQEHCAHHEGALLKHTQWQVQSPLQMVFLKLPRKAFLKSTWLLPCWSRFHPPNKISCF